MTAYEDFSADPSRLDAYRAAYAGRHDPLDALYWLDHPDDTSPSGTQAPSTGRDALKRAAYSRDATAESLRALAEFEAVLAADRAAVLAALSPTEPENDKPPAPARSRRPWLIAGVVVIVIALVAGVRLAIPAESGSSNAYTRVYPAPTRTYIPPTLGGQDEPAQPIPEMPEYVGPASCTNLVDPNSVLAFGNSGFSEHSAALYAQVADQTDWPLRPFIDLGGLLCVWGDNDNDNQVFYAYSPIDVGEAARQRAVLAERGLYDVTKNGSVESYTSGSEEFAIGDGYWIYAGSDDGLVSAEEVLSHVPENAGTLRTDLQSDVYATSEGLGDLRIGAKVRSRSGLVAWDDTACSEGGAWLPTGEFQKQGIKRTFEIVTEGRQKNARIALIRIFTPSIPSKSGVRVGYTVDQMNDALGKNFGDMSGGGSVSIGGTNGDITFEFGTSGNGDEAVVQVIVIVPAGTSAPSLGGDSNGPCAA